MTTRELLIALLTVEGLLFAGSAAALGIASFATNKRRGAKKLALGSAIALSVIALGCEATWASLFVSNWPDSLLRMIGVASSLSAARSRQQAPGQHTSSPFRNGSNVEADDLDHRFLAEGALAALRDHWGLEEFLGGANGQRAAYFEFVHDQIKAFARAGRLADDGVLGDAVILLLRGDRSYRVFLKEAGAEADLIRAEPWEELLAAGAGAILCLYFGDREI